MLFTEILSFSIGLFYPGWLGKNGKMPRGHPQAKDKSFVTAFFENELAG
jgi:hypothetical protein